jgi:hypothetical protein
MADYPQQLALAAILRWYGDPSRGFQQLYEIVWTRPHSLFKLLAAGLAWIVPIHTAGKLVVAASLAAVGPAALALCRRAGRPGWYALAALALTYNYAFFWGFVDNLIAYPLVLAGLALAERRFEQPWKTSSWIQIAGLTLAFYEVHLQFLLIFAGGVGWLALTRRPGWRRLAAWLSALLPGLALGVGVLAYASLRAPTGVITTYELRMRTAPTVMRGPVEKLAQIPNLLFGHSDGKEMALMALLVILGVVVATSFASTAAPGPRPGWWFRTRFATLAAWLWLLYWILPELHGGFLIARRIVPMAALVTVIALPPPAPSRRRLALGLAAALVLVQLGLTTAGFLHFRREAAGARELLAATAPGESLAGLIFDRRSEYWPRYPVFLHFPAYYQVDKGGRLLFSFAELYQTPVRYRPGESREYTLVAWDEWSPRRFSYPRHGGQFRYFLAHGSRTEIERAFGPALRERGIRSAGNWSLIGR